MTKHRREAGFTLIELMVGLALTAAILVLLFSGIGLGFKGMSRLDDQVARIEARRSLAYTLRRQIAAAYPATVGPAAGATFVGHPAMMSFLSLEGAAGPGYSRVWLMLEDTPSGRNLVLMRRPQAPDVWFGFERTVLARGVTRFSVAYFGGATPSGPHDWHDDWEGFRAPPELIRIALALTSDGSYGWPDEVVHIWTAGVQP
jgi:prepilin-type N-terminal cleavage/methylation domain-containing protein